MQIKYLLPMSRNLIILKICISVERSGCKCRKIIRRSERYNGTPPSGRERVYRHRKGSNRREGVQP